eukprot:SAG25_NODE_114_length_14860_cov_13.403672_12_plen_58_part_00
MVRQFWTAAAGSLQLLLLLWWPEDLNVLISFIYNLGLTNKPIKVPHRGYMLALTTKG